MGNSVHMMELTVIDCDRRLIKLGCFLGESQTSVSSGLSSWAEESSSLSPEENVKLLAMCWEE